MNGSPARTQSFARYPAVPILYKQLNQEAVTVLDDYGRDEEQQIGKLWIEQFKDLEAEEVDTEHGMLLLHRKSHKDNLKSAIDGLGYTYRGSAGNGTS